jgi:hypothetical protein
MPEATSALVDNSHTASGGGAAGRPVAHADTHNRLMTVLPKPFIACLKGWVQNAEPLDNNKQLTASIAPISVVDNGAALADHGLICKSNTTKNNNDIESTGTQAQTPKVGHGRQARHAHTQVM